MGSGYTRRGDYNVMKAKVEEVFYDPKVATKEIVDEVFETVNDRSKYFKSLKYLEIMNMVDLTQMNLQCSSTIELVLGCTN